jgi:hypothetical protein
VAELGCDLYQGYLMSRPTKADSVDFNKHASWSETDADADADADTDAEIGSSGESGTGSGALEIAGPAGSTGPGPDAA